MLTYTVLQTELFRRWLDDLPDARVQARISARLRMAGNGHFGDWKPVGGDVCEMRIDLGPGYRLYFTRRGQSLVVMLAGGDKSTQKQDIRQARRMSATLDI